MLSQKEFLQNISYIILALTPIVFILIYTYMKDKYDKEPLKYLILCFILGIIIAYPIAETEKWLALSSGLEHTIRYASNNMSFSYAFKVLIYTFFIIALVEEGFKYLVLRWVAYPQKSFNEPFDGIMYGVVVSMGFAAIENLIYIFRDSSGFEVALLRMFTAVPAHAVFGILMGYFVGLAKFEKDIKKSQLLHIQGFILAFGFHGLYDFFLFLNWQFVGLLAFVLLAVGLQVSKKALKIHAENSPFKKK